MTVTQMRDSLKNCLRYSLIRVRVFQNKGCAGLGILTIFYNVLSSNMNIHSCCRIPRSKQSQRGVTPVSKIGEPFQVDFVVFVKIRL